MTTEERGAVPGMMFGGAGRFARVGHVRQPAIFGASDAEFIQAGNEWKPGLVRAAFLRSHDSGTWVLEHRGRGCEQPARGFRLRAGASDRGEMGDDRSADMTYFGSIIVA